MIFVFINHFVTALQFVGPILGILALWIALTGLVVGRLEKWSKLDSVYYAFITATTVGYGDFRPKHRLSKIAAIILALAGLVFTGILVAAALKAIDYTLVEYNGLNLETLPEENLLLEGK